MSSDLNPCSTGALSQRHQLIILGNGFDLACGLHSSFSEFFSPRIADIGSITSKDDWKWVDEMVLRGYTAWDLILLSRKQLVGKGNDIAWCDVEMAIADVVQTSDGSGGMAADRLSITSIAKYFSFIRDFRVKMRPTEFVKRFSHRILDLDENAQLEDKFARRIDGEEVKDWAVEAFDDFIAEQQSDEYGCLPSDLYTYLEIAEKACPVGMGEQIGVFLRYRYTEVLKWDVFSIRNALMNELHLLEDAFNRYLSQEVMANSSYSAASSSLLSEICCRFDGETGSETPKKVTILNFNYTDPLTSGLDPGLRCIKVDQINVHGRLGGELIFGIDGSGCLSDSGQVRFSKTFRLLQLQEPSIKGPIAYPRTNAGACDIATVAIKFYGHSLSRADYSYFQSIFDAVDLYAGSVKLYFFYKRFKSTALDELLVNVANLLNEYGKSMDNQSHGRNLMHKLLLERRLIVEDIS